MNFITPTLSRYSVGRNNLRTHCKASILHIWVFFLLGGKTKEDTDFYLVWSKMLDLSQS